MTDWVKIGRRYVNLANVCEVRFDEHDRSGRLVYSGGLVETVDDDEATDLRDALLRRAAAPEEPHRTVFAPSH
jgi:hypothetical protein